MRDYKLTEPEIRQIETQRANKEEANKKSKAFNDTKICNEDSVERTRSTALKVNEDTMRKMFELHETVSSDLNKRFYETFMRINTLYGITLADIISQAQVSGKTLNGWKNGTQVGKLTVVRYAITFSLDLLVVETLLNSGGYKFNFSDKKEYAWAYLIMYYGGASLEECDRILKDVFGFEDSKYNQYNVYLTPVPRTKKNS